MTPDQGESLVGVRELWDHEERDFTPWLADHLHLLGNEIGLRLELVARESPVGPFSLDILAKEPDTGVLVAIENQLEWTDFQHFGQLLTYATGSKAQVVIWVAPVFRYETCPSVSLSQRMDRQWCPFLRSQSRTCSSQRRFGAPAEVPQSCVSGWLEQRTNMAVGI